MHIPLKHSGGLVILPTVATAKRLELENYGDITPQVGTNALYMPMALEEVTTRYIDNLKFCLYDCKTKVGKFFSQELDKRKREWESTITTDPKHREVVKHNADRLDKLLQRHVPRRIIFSPNSYLSRFALAALKTMTDYYPNGFKYFNGYEKDIIVKAYFTYRLVHLCIQAERNGCNIMRDTLRCRYAQIDDERERIEISKCYEKISEWKIPESWVWVAARTKQLVEVVACGEKYDDKERLRKFVLDVAKDAPMTNLLEYNTEQEMENIIAELQAFNIIEPKN